jgi:hypothetical protein
MVAEISCPTRLFYFEWLGPCIKTALLGRIKSASVELSLNKCAVVCRDSKPSNRQNCPAEARNKEVGMILKSLILPSKSPSTSLQNCKNTTVQPATPLDQRQLPSWLIDSAKACHRRILLSKKAKIILFPDSRRSTVLRTRLKGMEMDLLWRALCLS